MISERRVRAFFSGIVQGVGFRAQFARQARASGVRGWVRNLADDRVEALLEGASADIERLLLWSRAGMRWAVVEEIETLEEKDFEHFVDFDVR